MGKLTEGQLRAWMVEGRALAQENKWGRAPSKSDGGGLTFTLSAAGIATWTLRYRVANKQRELTLGNYPDMTLLAARAVARVARVKVDGGIDVATEKRRVKLEATRSGSFRELANDYLIRAGAALRERTQKENRRYLAKDILPRIGHLPAGDVSGSDIVILVEQIAKRSDSVARHAFSLLMEIFAHGVAKHFVKNNPCGGLKLKSILGPLRVKRTRIKLNEAEIHDLLQKLPSIGRVNELTIKIILATCVRKSELLLAKRSHVDLEAMTWAVPDENTKTGEGFVVPLAPVVAEWFRELMSISAAGKWLVSGRYGNLRMVSVSTRHDWVVPGFNGHMSRSTLNEAIKRLEHPRAFVPHDLRSTARTFLTSNRVGVSDKIAERCLNHRIGGRLIRTYDQNDYLEERRHALQLWANLLVEIEAGRVSNVAALKVAA